MKSKHAIARRRKREQLVEITREYLLDGEAKDINEIVKHIQEISRYKCTPNILAGHLRVAPDIQRHVIRTHRKHTTTYFYQPIGNDI